MQIQVDVDEMQNRLMEQKKVLSRQVQLEKKKVIPVGTVNQEGTEPVYDYAYRVHHMSLLERLENQLAKIDNALKRIEDGLLWYLYKLRRSDHGRTPGGASLRRILY